MNKYNTYIVNFNDVNNDGEFDYFIFNSQSTNDTEIIRQFRKLYKEDRGEQFNGLEHDILNIINFKPSNYPKI